MILKEVCCISDSSDHSSEQSCILEEIKSDWFLPVTLAAGSLRLTFSAEHTGIQINYSPGELCYRYAEIKLNIHNAVNYLLIFDLLSDARSFCILPFGPLKW